MRTRFLRPLGLGLFPSLLLAACGGGAAGGSDPPVTLIVTTLADDGPGSLRQTVADAPGNAEIFFDAAIAGGTVALSSPIEITKPVSILGAGSEITIDGGDSTGLFVVGGTEVHLSLLTLANGHGWDGGAILAESSTVDLERVTISSCVADQHGGAVFAVASDVELDRCHVVACSAESGGGLYVSGGESRILHSSVTFNVAFAGFGGGMVLAGGTRVLRSSTIHGNVAGGAGPLFDKGGGIYAGGAPIPGPIRLGIYGCTVTGNSAAAAGGGIHVTGEVVDNQFECRQSIVAENAAPTEPDLHAGGELEVTSAWNVVGDLAGGPIWNGLDGNLVGDFLSPVAPMLQPLTLLQGTLRRVPMFGSPVIDRVPHAESLDEAGDPLATDQHFFPRLTDAAADVGAVEF